METTVTSEEEMKTFGRQLGELLTGSEYIELIGDVGAGKTTFTKGLATGLRIDDTIQSPTFTINRVYSGRNDMTLSHYDFYRLQDAGIMKAELLETASTNAVVVIEWGDVVSDVTPADHLTIRFVSTSDTTRLLTLDAHGPISSALVKGLQQ